MAAASFYSSKYCIQAECPHSGKSDLDNSCHVSKDVPLSYMDGMDQKLPCDRNTSLISGFVLLVLDASAGPLQELYNTTVEFKRSGLARTACKVVWLLDHKPTASHGIFDLRSIEEDDIFSKPFHGSRLYQVIRLLPEFGGTFPYGAGEIRPSYGHPLERVIREDEEGSTSSEKFNKKATYSSEMDEEKPLSGVKFLVVDDDTVGSKVTTRYLQRLGATFEQCKNGAEALSLIRASLSNQRRAHIGASSVLPYDCILMDCEMPVMDGCEATREIRKEERHHGIYMPVIGLTSHSLGEAEKMKKAGIDAHIQKPLDMKNLIETIKEIRS